MKTLLTSFFLLFAVLCFSQTKEEASKILATYNKSAKETLNKKFLTIRNEQKSRVNEFLKKNPLTPRFKDNKNNIAELYDVIDNTPLYRTTYNANSAIATRTNYLHNGGGLGLNIEGQNMTIGIWDGGSTLSTHVEFYDATGGSRVTVNDGSSSHGHATHVGGTLVAKGTNTNAKGMAPQAHLESFDWNNDLIELNIKISSSALLLSNHSYGLDAFGDIPAPSWYLGAYDSEAVQVDELHYNYPYYLMVVSAGNDGTETNNSPIATGNYDKLSKETVSKNNLAVANANNPNINTSGEVTSYIANVTSSQGPTDDGRIKPDIAGDGTSVFSTYNGSNFDYETSSGTSMASPNVAGSLLLLQQYYNELNGSFMRAATLKALACHNADDDILRVGPDPSVGWGLLNTKKSAETISNAQNNTAVILETSLSNNSTFTYTFSASSSEPVKVSICWTDPAGIDHDGELNNTDAVLVNDLDLRVTDSEGTTFLPWKLNLSNLSGGAIKGDNLVDPIERVDIDSPVLGTFTITVSHKGTLVDDEGTTAPQNFSLIVTGENLVLSNDKNTLVDNFTVWPNPTKNNVNIQFANNYYNKNVSLQLIDALGRTVLTKNVQITNLTQTINVSNYAKGIYLLKINDGTTSTLKKLVIN